MDDIANLLNVLRASYSGQKNLREEATQYLLNNSGTPGLCALLTQVITSEDPTIDPEVRQSAAANLYSLVQRSWNPENSPYAGIPDADKAVVRGNIVELMLYVPPALFKVLSGTLQTIVAHDFPHNWPQLMPELVARLQSDDPNQVIQILRTMNSVLKYYRDKPNTADYVKDLLAVLEVFGNPMRELFNLYSQQFDVNQANPDALVILIKLIRLLWEMFFSLTSIDIPQVMVNHLTFWMVELKKFLTWTTTFPQLLPDPDDNMSSRPGLVTKLHTTLVKIVAMFTKKYDEDFEPYIQEFLSDIWNLLGQVAELPQEVQIHYDGLVIEALAFLTTTITGVHHKLFEVAGILESVATSIVVPNIRFTEQSMELFEYQALEYIRADSEGSDSYTRRRSAIELVKGVRRYYESDITRIFSGQIESLLAEYSANPEENWYLKDQAIYLVIALTATSQTRTKGVVAINELVPLIPFFEESILPELEEVLANANSLNARAVVKADCLRFAMSFRRHLTAEHCVRLISIVVAYLNAESGVVSSYAAVLLDGLLSMKDGARNRLSFEIVEAHLETLFGNLFARVASTSANKFESENPYMSQAVARLISFVGGNIIPYAQNCLDQLTNKLSEIYKNPTNAKFLHNLFESIAAIIGALVNAGRAELCESVEGQLSPAFAAILAEEASDLAPYVFQLMVQFIEAKKGEPEKLVERYGPQFSEFVAPKNWERFGNIPALTRVLTAYIKYVPGFVSEHIVAVLGTFKRVNELRTYERYAFRLITAVCAYMEPTVWRPHIARIFSLMFDRLRNGKPLVYVNAFVEFLANVLFLDNLGPASVVSAMDAVQPGIFNMVLKDVVIPAIPRHFEFRSVAVGFTILLASPVMLQQYKPHWVPVLEALINLLVGNTAAANGEVNGTAESAVEGAQATTAAGEDYQANFAQLRFAGASEASLVPAEVNPKQFLAGKLGEVSAQVPGELPPLLESLPASSIQYLKEILETYQVAIQ